MKHISSLLHLLLLLTLLSGCEKSIDGDGESGASTTNGITEEMMRNALTVTQALHTDGGTKVTVKGYIVAAAENSIKKADFSAPFEGSTALVLAQTKSNGSEEQFYYDELLPVCLTDAGKGIRDTYNLEENNQYWNKFVYVSGTRKEYMSVPGMKKVQAIYIDNNHIPTADEEAEETESEETEEQQDDIVPPAVDWDGETIDGHPVLSVEQAINDALLYDNVYVKGYLIAVTKRSMGNMRFEPPFTDYTAIVLADSPADTPEQTAYYQAKENRLQLFPVGLPADERSRLKLEEESKETPKYYNQLVVVFGCKSKYMNQAGIPKGYVIAP